jgi:aspartate aminotransferase
MFHTLLALLDPGDEVLLPNPAYPICESFVNFLGARPVELPLLDTNDFDLDLKDLEREVTSRTRLPALNSPQNPTGCVLERETLEDIGALACQHDFMILADEICGRSLYEGEPVAIASLPGMAERTIVLDAFSKTCAMTGWCLGFGIMNQALARHVTRLQTRVGSCAAAFTQRAGIEAFTGPEAEPRAMVEEFRRRRDVFVDGLNATPGSSCVRPRGAFDVFPKITKTGFKSRELEIPLRDEAGANCLSGAGFGSCSEGHLRFSYANSRENIQLALENIRAFPAEAKN